jgi:hypothetical protein
VNISHQDASRIELEHVPTQWVIGLGAVCFVLLIGFVRALFEGAVQGALVALAMLAALSWFVLTRVFRRFRLVLDRGTGVVRVTASTVFGERETTYPLGDLLRVETDTRYEEGNSAAEPTLALVLADGGKPRRVRLDPFRPRPEDLLFASGRINAWLGTDPDTREEAGDAGESRP